MDARMTKRRYFSDKFKAALALEVLRGDKTVQEIAANTSKKHPQHRVYPYLLRKLAITRPNQVWCSDIT
jgi:transposase InsO family protein